MQFLKMFKVSEREEKRSEMFQRLVETKRVDGSYDEWNSRLKERNEKKWSKK